MPNSDPRDRFVYPYLTLMTHVRFLYYTHTNLACCLGKHKLKCGFFTPNGYTVPVEFCVDFLPRMKNVLKCTKMHLNDTGLTETEFCKSQVQLRQPPISWKICCFSAFYNTGVMIPVIAIRQGC